MPEPVTMTTVGLYALSEGVKFLYGQAADLIKDWRARKKSAEPSEPTLAPIPPDTFDGPLDVTKADLAVLDNLEVSVVEAADRLASYAAGMREISTDDKALLRATDDLRRLLEEVLGQRITFVGEDRPASGSPVVRGQLRLGTVEDSYAAGVDVGNVASGVIDGTVEANEVRRSTIIGTRAGTVGTVGETQHD